MLTELLLPLPKTGKNPPLQLILIGWQAEQEQGHRGQFVVNQTAVIMLLDNKTLLNLTVYTYYFQMLILYTRIDNPNTSKMTLQKRQHLETLFGNCQIGYWSTLPNLQLVHLVVVAFFLMSLWWEMRIFNILFILPKGISWTTFGTLALGSLFRDIITVYLKNVLRAHRHICAHRLN